LRSACPAVYNGVVLGARRPGVVLATLVAVLAFAPGAALAQVRPSSGGGECDQLVDPYAQTVAADTPLVYYALDESSGTTICDYAGNDSGSYASSGVTYGVAGPLAGDPTQTAVSAAGGTPGGNPVGTVPAQTGLSGNHSFTLEGWFDGTSAAPDQVLVALNGGSTDGLTIWPTHCHSGSDVYIGLDEHGTDNCWDAQSSSGIDVLDGHWHYLAVTYDAASGQVDAYVDGHDLGSQPLNPSATIAFSDPAVLLGGWTDTTVNQPFSGAMAQVAIYGSALSAGAISGHYAAASAAPVLTAPRDLTDSDVAPIQTTNHGTYSWKVGGAAGSPLQFYPVTSPPQAVASVAAKTSSTIADPEVTLAPELALGLSAGEDELTGATVTIPDPVGLDTLTFTAPSPITGSYSQTGSTAVLTLSGLASVEDYQSALQSVAYHYAWSTTDPGVYVDGFEGDQTLTVGWQVSDGSSVSATSNTQLQILMPNLLTTDTGSISGGSAPCDAAPATLVAGPHVCLPASLTVGGSASQVAYDDLQSLGNIIDQGPIVIAVDPATTNNACSVSQSQSVIDGVATIRALAAGQCVIDESQDISTGVSGASPTTQFAPALDQLEFSVLAGPQSVAFDSTSPGKANAGASYSVSAHSSSGSAVSFAIDARSQAGSCTLGGPAASVVSFTGPGSCVIDANVAASANYTAAQAQQTVVVSGISVHAIGLIRATGTTVGFSLPCAGGAGASCTGTVSLVAGEQLNGSKPTGVIASAGAVSHRRRTVAVTLGREHYVIAGGQHKTITIRLNALARRLLRTFHRLPSKLDDTPTGAAHTTVLRTLTIKPAKRKRKK
jgi:hypothetical protein